MLIFTVTIFPLEFMLWPLTGAPSENLLSSHPYTNAGEEAFADSLEKETEAVESILTGRTMGEFLVAYALSKVTFGSVLFAVRIYTGSFTRSVGDSTTTFFSISKEESSFISLI